MKIIERTLHLLDEKSLKMADLCRKIDVSTSTMANWKTRKTDPPASKIALICEFLNVTCDYLLTGKEAPSSISPADQELLDLFHSLPEQTQVDFRGWLRVQTGAWNSGAEAGPAHSEETETAEQRKEA